MLITFPTQSDLIRYIQEKTLEAIYGDCRKFINATSIEAIITITNLRENAMKIYVNKYIKK